ncbi:hypothetical protein ACSBR2_028152 [Camellia fascicularis]
MQYTYTYLIVKQKQLIRVTIPSFRTKMIQKMNSNPEKHTLERLQVPARPPSTTTRYRTAASQGFRSNCVASSSPRPQQRICTRSSSCSSRSVRSGRPEFPVPRSNFRRQCADKEILRRALTPPVRRRSCRWWDFRPTPSRLCNMSMA